MEQVEVEAQRVVPRRVRLPRAALDRLAELSGVPSPAAQMVSSSGSPSEWLCPNSPTTMGSFAVTKRFR